MNRIRPGGGCVRQFAQPPESAMRSDSAVPGHRDRRGRHVPVGRLRLKAVHDPVEPRPGHPDILRASGLEAVRRGLLGSSCRPRLAAAAPPSAGNAAGETRVASPAAPASSSSRRVLPAPLLFVKTSCAGDTEDPFLGGTRELL